MTDDLGLRERKKLATRQALCDAALKLALAEGVTTLTPERIAEKVHVSPRTFRNYFSSKEEAIVAGLQDRAQQVAENLRRRPADEPIWESLRAVLVPSLDTGMPGPDLRHLLGLIRCHHALLAEHLTSFEALSRQMAEVIAERTGTDVNRDIYPRLLADVSGIALKASLGLWATGTTGRGLGDIFGEALDLLSRGLPRPAVAPEHSADTGPPAT
ncbi:TetR family transcriptional regulator [Amorphoplanes nipponensis]|uniref:TetR family transcriptional regulator n=1 Tax=Actinoplanes nipponensis TaxID=135950 RepID=A0A919MTG4_9ACTN|nr:TetR/AcrR family transcriptional regulator [Actinoplanes nipponensis]GIE49085.1 TetR family transcriptional regulator [Actinoplanes nipponensis]